MSLSLSLSLIIILSYFYLCWIHRDAIFPGDSDVYKFLIHRDWVLRCIPDVFWNLFLRRYIGLGCFRAVPMYLTYWFQGRYIGIKNPNPIPMYEVQISVVKYIGMGQICCIPMYRHFGTIIYTSESSFRDIFRCIWQQHTSEWHILDESRCIPLWFARIKTTTEIHLVAACFLWLISRGEVASSPSWSPRNSSPPPNNTSVLESCPEFRAHRFHPRSK